MSDAETGCSLKHDPETGAVDEGAPGAIGRKGLVQSLVARGLIYPTGKPTSKDFEAREEFDTLENSGAQSSAGEESGEAPADSEDGPVPLPAEEETDQRDERRKVEVIIDQRLRLAMPPLPSAAEGKEEPDGIPAAQHAEASVRPVDETLVALLAQQSFEAEQFKILRTNLLYPVSGKPPRSILITSLDQGDGKSFVVANLAVSMALNLNRHVLVIDCDLRKPSMHTIFGFGDVPGLREYISEGRTLPSLLLRTKVERLSLLPAGTPPPNPSELLSSERMAALIQEVTRRYKDRLVLIDSPPPTLTAEPAVLARQVDGILLVAKYGRTRMPDLLKVAEKLGKEKILGSVINYFEHSVVDYYGYRKYGRYGRYQDGSKA
jgi:capsular exopolysaccharide synthesis family protein